jgi:hypothetical protein
VAVRGEGDAGRRIEQEWAEADAASGNLATFVAVAVIGGNNG